MNKQIIFIYNAKSGAMHGIKDLLHKSIKPSTYPCKLCQISFSGATMNKIWKQYISELDTPAIFLHKNEFYDAYPNEQIVLPAILLLSEQTLDVLISAEDFKKINDVTELISAMKIKLASIDSALKS